MLQTNEAGLRIATESESPQEQPETTPKPQARAQDHYARASAFALDDYEYPVPGFVNELLDELEKDVAVEDAKLVDTVDPSKDIDDGLLVAYPDQSLMFIGSDPTAKDQMPWYAFTIEPFEPIPAPESAKDALDLLKPPEVRDTIEDTGWIPDRHGEWWLLPTDMVPLSETFKPGVKTDPYGPSPLGNHVPREYAFTVTADAFMDSFRNHVPEAPSTVATPPEVIQWSFRQQNKPEEVRPDYAPDWADIRQWADDVLVKGTIRHRDDDHFVEDCGEQWHKAVTHRIEVYTSDAIGEGVHLDYYGT